MPWYDMVRYDMKQYDTMRYNAIQYDMFIIFQSAFKILYNFAGGCVLKMKLIRWLAGMGITFLL